MVRYLLGSRGFISDEVTPADYDRALDVLRNRLTCFGIQERFQESLQLLAFKTGMKFVADFKANAAGTEDSIQPWELDRHDSFFKFDQLLYLQALELFDEQLTSMPKLPVCSSKLMQFALKVLAKIR